MRRTLVIFAFLAGIVLAPMSARAQGIDPAQENFVNAFLAVRKAEEQAAAGDNKTALKTYRAAADTLSKIKQQWPNWQPELLDYRLKRTLDAINQLNSKVGPGGGEAADVGALPPLGDDPSLLPPVAPLDSGVAAPAPVPRAVNAKGRRPEPVKIPDGEDPLVTVKNRINTLETQLQEANERLASEQQKNDQIAKDLTEAVDARKKAETERKKAADLADVYQKSVLELKGKTEDDRNRGKELELQLSTLRTKTATSDAELAAAEERINQLLERSRAVAQRASDASGLPNKIKQLETKLVEEQTAKKDLTDRLTNVTKERDEARLEVKNSSALPGKIKQLEAKLTAEEAAKKELSDKLTGVTQERDDAKKEITRLKDANKQVDKLMADNASLLKKLGDAEKMIVAFKEEAPQKDAEITALKKQVTETQKALEASTDKNTNLQSEVGELKKKIEDYSKQIQQAKTDKTASAEDRRKMEEENKLLQGIVMRVLQEDANRSQRKKMVQKELDRLQVQSDVLLKQINFLTEPVVKLSSSERRLFKRPIIDVQDPNTIVAIKTDAAPDPAPGDASPGAPTTSVEAAAPTPASNNVVEVAKLDTKHAGDLPGREPEAPITTSAPPQPVKNSGNGSGIGGLKGLPEEVRPLAEQAKQAFERDKYTDAEKIYEKALQLAPNNLYLWSNKGVTQFRAGKFKNAEESFRKALAIAPEDHFSWCTLGIVEYSQGKYDEAVNSLTKSLAINSKNATAHNYLGITAAQKGWIEAAQKELETALQLDGKYADAWFNLAVTQTLKTPPNKDEAKKAYQKAIEFGAEPDAAMENLVK